jgi:hypothetical protein
MTINLFDGIAVIRRDLETDDMGRAPRVLFNKMLSLPAGDIAIWCWDGAGAKKHRQAIYPPYKANREPQPSAIWKTIQMMQEVFKHTPALQVTVPTYEADDLIAHLARDCKGQEVMIHSVDRDLSALFTLPGVKGTFPPPKDVLPYWVSLYKCCVGDASDNIKGIPGFGRKTWDKVDALNLLPQLRDMTLLAKGTPELLEVLPTKVKNWLDDEANWPTLGAMQEVIAFRRVEVALPWIVGKKDLAAGDKILKEFLL